MAFDVTPCGYPPQTSSPSHHTPTCPGIVDEPERKNHLCTSCHNKWVLVEAYKQNQREKQASNGREEEQRTKDPVEEDEVDKLFRQLIEKEATEKAAAETEWEDVITR